MFASEASSDSKGRRPEQNVSGFVFPRPKARLPQPRGKVKPRPLEAPSDPAGSDTETTLGDYLVKAVPVLEKQDPWRAYMVQKIQERLERDESEPGDLGRLQELLKEDLAEKEPVAASIPHPVGPPPKPPWKLQQAPARPPLLKATSKYPGPSLSFAAPRPPMNMPAPAPPPPLRETEGTNGPPAKGMPKVVPPPKKKSAPKPVASEAKPPPRVTGPGGTRHEGFYYQFFDSKREYERLVRRQFRKRGGKNQW